MWPSYMLHKKIIIHACQLLPEKLFISPRSLRPFGGGILLLKVPIGDLKQGDAFNTMWWPVLSIDKCCQVTSLSIERTDHHVLLKALSCLRSLLGTSSKTIP